jgi:hypothetical protein
MIIKKRFEKLINLENHNLKKKFENVKICTEVEEAVVIVATDPIERIKEIKQKGLLLGKIARSITEQEIKEEIEKITKEVANVGQ